MTTTSMTPETVSDPAWGVARDQRVSIFCASWDEYQAMLAIQKDRSNPQVVFLDGEILLLAPSEVHKRINERLRTMIYVIVTELDIPSHTIGQTTLIRPDLGVGVQPDASYYFANHGVIGAEPANDEIDLMVDPPPDLAIEIIDGQDAEHAIEGLCRLGVPEVWVVAPDRLIICVLGENGRYASSETSISIPFLTANELFYRMVQHGPGYANFLDEVRELRRWAREELIPLAQGWANDA